MDDIKQRDVVWHKKNKKISQIPREGLEFAFVSKDYKQIHQLVWCKDFMQDSIFGHLNQKKISIYGFSYDPEIDPPLYMEKTRIFITNFKDANFGSKVTENLREFLHGIEGQLKMAKTTFEKCKSPPPRYRKAGVYILNSSKRWMKSPPMISLYTLLLRIGMVHELGDPWHKTFKKVQKKEVDAYYSKTDNSFAEQAKNGLDFILEHGDRKVFHRDIQMNYPETVSGMVTSVFTIHDNCGLLGFSRGSTKLNFPHWHRLEKAKK